MAGMLRKSRNVARNHLKTFAKEEGKIETFSLALNMIKQKTMFLVVSIT